MCVSSNLRCGSCLANWNGKAWEETYKCILPLKSWTVVLNKKHELCIEGQCDLNFSLTVCVPITEILNSYWIISECTLVKLRGAVNTKNIPSYIAKKFSNGVPSDWKATAGKWVEYIQKGEKAAFNWTQDESFASSDTSFLLSPVRHLSSGRSGKTKEKSVQSKRLEISKTNEQDKDSAMPSSEHTSPDQETNLNSIVWCPWLPAHKVEEICKWVDHANPLVDMAIDNENVNSQSVTGSVNPSDSASCQVNQKRKEQRVQSSENVVQNPRHIVPQSTPLSNIHESRVLQTLDFDISAIGKASDITNITDDVEDVFRIPRIALPAGKVANLKNNSKNAPGNSLKISQPLAVTPSNNVEIPGTRMTRMLSRPRRKPSVQKIERWRPVLGVDGLLKVQGYLLLTEDKTAGQILTTNPVIQWGHRKVETNDGKEYELVGEPYENISDDLRSRLLKPISCEEIISKLQEYQTLKDRSDWGAEYELFYGNDSAYGTSSSRISHSPSSDRRHHTTPKMYRSNTQGPTSACEIMKAAGTNETPKLVSEMRLNKPNFQLLNSSLESESGSPSMSSSIRKSSRITERQRQGKYQSWKNKTNMRRCVNKEDGTNVSSDESRYINESNRKGSVEIPKNADGTRSCFENVNWSSPQNQMMLPSSRLASESPHVHFSPSRIKVSYLNNSTIAGQKAVQTVSQNSSMKQLRLGGWSEDFSTIVSPHTDSSTSLTSPQCSPLCPSALVSHVHYSPKTMNTSVRVSSQSPVRRTTTEESLQSSIRRNSSAPASLFHRISKHHANKSTANKSSSTKTSKNSADKPILRIPATKTPAKTATKTPKSGTASRTFTKTDTKTPGTKIDTKIPGSTTSASECSKKLVSPAHISKTPVTRSASTKIPATPSCTSCALTPENSRTKSVTSSNSITVSHKGPYVKTRGGRSLTPLTRSSKVPTTRTSAKKTPAKRTSARKAHSARASSGKIPVTDTSTDKIPATCTAASKTPASKQLVMTNSSRSSGRAKCTKMKEPWVVVKRLDIKHDFPDNCESDKKVTISKNGHTNSVTKKVKPVSKKTESTKSVARKGKENSKSKTTKTTEKKTSKTKTIKEKRTKTEKERFPSSAVENENNADDNASDCSNLSDMSIGPSASVIFALDSPSSRRAPRTLKERRERDKRLKQMEKHLLNKEDAADANIDDDPMAHLLSSYKYSALPQEWCKHENILRQNRKRRRPSSSDGTTPPHSAFDDGFGNEDATSSVATPQLLMRPPDPKQVQSYLQRQRALNSRAQRPTRPVKRDKNYVPPDIDYGAAFRNDMSDSEESSVVSDVV